MLHVDWKRKRWIPKRLARDEVPPLGTREILCNWVRDEDLAAPMIEMKRYAKLLTLLPDKVVENLERSRLAQDGRIPMLKAGLGYEELLSSVIVDGTAVGTSAAEAKLAPALLIPANYMQPGGIPGRHLRVTARGRGTTLTTAATMILRHRIAATDVITGTALCASGAMAADATAQTATQWQWDADMVVRSVGSAGTVFAQGKANLAWHVKNTGALEALAFAGSAGSATPAAVTWDMTAAQFFQFTGIWSLATAYSMQTHIYALEALN
ncbi:MAG: hypothetical protein H0U82_00285 [Actinobacteria bacterium]|nr:hypothetical protein [Actinomycetota bacterium]